MKALTGIFRFRWQMCLLGILAIPYMGFIRAHAQSHNTKFERRTAEDGLSQSHINCILQDRNDFLWFGTNGGLNRYNGLDFEIFRNESADSLSISNNIITDLLEEDDGTLYIATQNGLNVYDWELEQFHLLDLGSGVSLEFGNQPISALCKDRDGYIWAGTMGAGAVKFKVAGFAVDTVMPFPVRRSGSAGTKVAALASDNSGYLWIGYTDTGIDVVDTKTGDVIKHYGAEGQAHYIGSDNIHKIYKDSDGDIWVGTANGLVLIRDHDGAESISRFFQRQNPASGTAVSVQTVLEDASGRIWFGTNNRGLGALDKNTGSIEFYRSDPNDPNALLSNNVLSLHNDNAGILWIGTNAGINMIDDHSGRFRLFKRQPGAENTISSSNVQAIIKEPSGVVWIGTHDQGLNKYDPLTRTYTTYLQNDILEGGESLKNRANILQKYNRKLSDITRAKLQYLSHNRILSLHLDPVRPYLWIGTGGGGLNQLNLYTGKIHIIKPIENRSNSLGGAIIRSIDSDKGGGLWIGTEDGGLTLYNGARFLQFRHDPDDPESISSDHVRCIEQSESGQVWVGTFDGGLNLFDRKTRTFKRFRHSEEDPTSISSNTIFCLLSVHPDTLWIGTDNGLNLFNVQDGTFSVFKTDHGLASNSIYGMLVDGEGNLWMSSNAGLTKFNPARLKCRNYDNKDGLQGSEFNPNACYQTRSGEMLFGGIEGYNTFFPGDIRDNNYIPKIVITDFSILNEKIFPDQPNSPLSNHISDTDTIVLPHTRNTFSFEFVALNYTGAGKNEYAYILENFDEQWIFSGTRRYASYTNVPPGKYRFKVIGSNNDGLWNYTGSSVTIIINPPFWNTWWFIAIMAALALAVIYAIIHLRTMQLQRMKVVLERLVTSRTQQLEMEKTRVEKANQEITLQKEEIQKQHDMLYNKNKEVTQAKIELDSLNRELRTINYNLEGIVAERTIDLRKLNKKLVKANNELDRFIYRASHDLKGPIARLLGLAMIAKMDKNEHELDGYIDLIQMNAVEMNRAINKLNSVHQINKRTVHYAHVDLAALIADVNSKISKYIDVRPINIKVAANPRDRLYCDPVLLVIILENLLENALMFKKKEEVNVLISMARHGDGYRLDVTDDGIGIPAEQHKKIFDMFFRGTEKSIGSGLGLYLVKKAVEKLNGSISLASKENHYTKFEIYLPLKTVEYQH
jgi:ligand-binding sensor domain-containing protein/signal transduction histidine kinase